jgi:hypothetical protein
MIAPFIPPLFVSVDYERCKPMRIIKTGNNTTELHTSNYALLISYETPVAVRYHDDSKVQVTDRNWSRTTSKHIGTFTKGASNVEKITQASLDALLQEIGTISK